MTDTTDDLKLYEEITLLALHDTSGRLRGDHPRHRIAGAIITGLILRGAARVVEDRKSIISHKRGEDLEDRILRSAWEFLEARKKPYAIADFLGHLSAEESLVDDIANGLCEKGILKSVKTKFLWFFEIHTYPEIDPAVERAVILRMQEVIVGLRAADERTTALIALAGTYGLLPFNLGFDFVKQHKDRIDMIVKGNAIANATRELIEAIDLMIIMAAATPALVTVLAS